MASAQVMAMPVDTAKATEKEPRGAAAATSATRDAGAQDVYVKLKSLQKHMEFLDIQVRGEGREQGARGHGLSFCGRLFLARKGGSLDFGVFFPTKRTCGTGLVPRRALGTALMEKAQQTLAYK